MASPHSKHKRQHDSRMARKVLRGRDRRINQALSATKENEARLEARIKFEQALTTAQSFDKKDDTEDARKAAAILNREFAREHKRELWHLGAARSLIRQGYSLEGTIERTGWDREWLHDADIFGDWL